MKDIEKDCLVYGLNGLSLIQGFGVVYKNISREFIAQNIEEVIDLSDHLYDTVLIEALKIFKDDIKTSLKNRSQSSKKNG